MRSETETAGGVSERGARGERTSTAGVDGSPAPRERRSCGLIEKEESAGWGATHLVQCDEAGCSGFYIGNSGLIAKETKP